MTAPSPHIRKLAVVVPTYNEAVNLDAIIGEIGRALEHIDYEIIIADDDSPDLTWQKAEEISRSNTRVRVLRRKTNHGLAPAVADGMALADSEWVACIDGDLQHDAAILPIMLAELEAGKTIAAGSRYVAGGGIGKWNLIRRIASKTATFAASTVTGLDLKDPMSGYFMMRRTDFMKVRHRLNLRGFKILLEIASHLDEPKIAEVPYTFRPRHLGESKLTWMVIWNYLLQLIDLYRDLHPRRLRFLKTSIIGFGAIIINLLVFLMVVQALGWRDWRASALGTLIAVLSGVGLRKWWLSKRRARARVTVKSSARSLRLATTGLVTLVLNTTSFALLFWAVADPAPAGAVRTLTLVICQTISILLGVGINYILDEHVSWRHGAHSSSFAVKAPNQ